MVGSYLGAATGLLYMYTFFIKDRLIPFCLEAAELVKCKGAMAHNKTVSDIPEMFELISVNICHI